MEIVEGWAWERITNVTQLGKVWDPEEWTGFGRTIGMGEVI